MTEQFVVVAEPGSEEPVELPTNADDSSLSANVLERMFPGAYGLKYKNPSTGAFRAVMLDESGSKFLPPSDGWDGKLLIIVKRPPGDESEHGKKRKKNGDGGESAGSSDDDDDATNGERKRSKKLRGEDKAVCSDLIVLGLPYKLSDTELKEYFEQFGAVLLSEVKKTPSGESRGFGFIQMNEYADQIRVLAKPNHLIGGRKCQVRMPLSKNGEVREPNLILNPKLFVTRLPEGTTVERLNEFFTEQVHKLDPKASVLDVYIPKPFRGFSFITLSSPAVAKEMIRQADLIFDGASIAITAAVPRDTTKPKPMPPGYAPRPPFGDGPRMGPRNGPVGPVYGGGGGGPSDYYDHRGGPSGGGFHQRYDPRFNDNNKFGGGGGYGGNDPRDNGGHRGGGGGTDDVMGMNPEVMTAAFKAFLSAAQQSITNGGGAPGDGGPYDGPGGYNSGGGMMGDGNPPWRC